MEQENTNPNQRLSLDEASRVELRMLLLLDWMMAFDQLHAEKQDLEKTLIELQAQVDSLKKGFFKSVEEEDGFRVDEAVTAGKRISMYYDPMIAKLCTYAEDRETAVAMMEDALSEYIIRFESIVCK